MTYNGVSYEAVKKEYDEAVSCLEKGMSNSASAKVMDIIYNLDALKLQSKTQEGAEFITELTKQFENFQRRLDRGISLKKVKKNIENLFEEGENIEELFRPS